MPGGQDASRHLGASYIADCVSTAVSSTSHAWVWTHAASMMLAWGVVLPTGVLFSAVARKLGFWVQDGRWLEAHRALQCTGVVVVVASATLAHMNVTRHADSSHGTLGLWVTVLVLAQPLNAVLRPHAPDKGSGKSTTRIAWEILHRVVGYGMLAAAWTNAHLGMDLAEDLGVVSPEQHETLVGKLFGCIALVCLICLVTVTWARAARNKSGNSSKISIDLDSDSCRLMAPQQ